MKKMKLIIWAFMLSLILPFQALAIDENWILVEEGSSIIKFSEAEIFENNLKQKVSKLQQDSLASGEKYIFRYNLDIVKNEKTEEDTTTKKDITKIDVEQEFYTVKDAEDYYNEIELQAPLHKGEFSIKPLKRSKTVKGEEKEIVCGSNDCSDVINRLKLEESISKKLVYDIYHVEEILGEEKEVYYFENNMLKLFDTKKEAEEFASEYVPYEQGFKFIGNDVVETVVTTEQEEYITETYKTESEAQAALDNLKSEYTIKSSSITPIRNMEKDTEEILQDETYESELDAQKRVYELNQDKTSDYEVKAIYNEVVERLQDNTKIESILNGTYLTKERLDKSIEELENQGWIIDEKYVEKIPGEVTGTVTKAIKDPNSKSSYIIDSSNNYVLIKQGAKGTVAVWTLNELSDEAKEEFKKTYKNVTDDGSTSGDLDITFISGYNTFNLSNLGNGWGTDYTFSKGENGSTILTIPSRAVSHIVYGYAEESNAAYKVTGLMHKEIKKYIVSASKSIYGFDYKLEVNLQKEIIEEKYKIKSKFKKIEQQESHKIKYRFDLIEEEEYYLLSYETFTYDLIEYADANYIIEKLELSIGGGNEDIKDEQQDEILPPNTGVEVKQKHSMMYILFILSALLISKKFLEEKLSK